MRAKVWNDNTYPYTEKFREQVITIPPKSFVEMDFDDAHNFKSSYSPILVDFDNQPLASSYKMIRVEVIGAPKEEKKGPISCHACGETMPSMKALSQHIDAMHLDQLDDPEVAQKRRSKKDAVA